MGGIEATEVLLRCRKVTLLMRHSRGPGHGMKWTRECHVLWSRQRSLRSAKRRRHRWEGSVRGQGKGWKLV